MKAPLVHGCYDIDTLRTLKEAGIRHFGFDLRGRSPNLIPFYQLKDLLTNLSSERVHLMFENDKASTIISSLDMLKDIAPGIQLEFRDEQSGHFYDSFKTPYVWMFSPQADWESVLMSTHLRGLLLPVFHQSFYQANPKFWELIERRQLETYVHAVSFSEALEFHKDDGLQLSVDMTKELEIGFRSVDQRRLKKQILEIF